jgi:hypothetical protein
MNSYVHLWQYLAQLFLKWEMFQTKVVEKIKTHFTFHKFFSPTNRAIYEITWKNMLRPNAPQMTI